MGVEGKRCYGAIMEVVVIPLLVFQDGEDGGHIFQRVHVVCGTAATSTLPWDIWPAGMANGLAKKGVMSWTKC